MVNPFKRKKKELYVYIKGVKGIVVPAGNVDVTLIEQDGYAVLEVTNDGKRVAATKIILPKGGPRWP